MSKPPTLPRLFAGLNRTLNARLQTAREANTHPGTKGDASENVWLDVFNTYLPKRYMAANAHVIDSRDDVSDQIDVLIFDRQYTPFIFHDEGAMYVPAESVYAGFEVKQEITAAFVDYAQTKIASVRKLYRTSLNVPTVNGIIKARPPSDILGGIICLDSRWSPAMGAPLINALDKGEDERRLDMGCIAANGFFWTDIETKAYQFEERENTAPGFIFRLITELQRKGTVPMIDIQAYANWSESGC